MWRSILLNAVSLGIAAAVVVLIASGQGSIVLVAGGVVAAVGAAAINWASSLGYSVFRHEDPSN